jgi:XRE family transcriptional regulator, regulator of sulfur utilization
MTDQPDITTRLAVALREARRTRGLSLDAVAKLSGVSRSMVSQIERGESSPTVATLWNLTRALQVDFAGLLDAPSPPAIEVVRAAAAPTIAGRGEGVTIRILSPPETVGSHEVYDLAFTALGRLVSDAHGPGCREHLTVIDGSLRVTSGDAVETLHPGDTARYPADRLHRIEATGAPARALLIVQGS